MAAVAGLTRRDAFVRAGLQVLHGAGLRVGELLDLELSVVVDVGAAGTWLQVPIGNLATDVLDAAPLPGLTIRSGPCGCPIRSPRVLLPDEPLGACRS